MKSGDTPPPTGITPIPGCSSHLVGNSLQYLIIKQFILV